MTWTEDQIIDAGHLLDWSDYDIAALVATLEEIAPDGESKIVSTFRVEDKVQITGRGPAITRSQERSKEAWKRGERFKLGATVRCGALTATVGGIERFCVPEGHPAHNDGALLLKGIDFDDLEVGQLWVQDVEP